jgi:hypothetical protein
MDASEEAKQFNLHYLASPYSHYYTLHAAWRDASNLGARLLKCGYRVFSPIAHSHSYCLHGGLDPLDHGFWMAFDDSMMRVSDALMIAMLDGWKQSKGVKIEIEFFEGQGRPIYCVNPNTLKIVRYK